MDPLKNAEGIGLELQIEELEAKVAPDAGETVLPLPRPGSYFSIGTYRPRWY